MGCGWFDILDDGTVITCPNEATHTNNCEPVLPVCAGHACKHAITFAEAEWRREAMKVPASWLAL